MTIGRERTRFTYETVGKVVRVKVDYNRGVLIEEGQISKVYRVGTMWTPSGQRYTFLVWSKKANKCVWIRCDDVDVLEWSETKIHEVG